MAENMENRSLRLYNFLSDKLGSEDTVRTRRTYYITHNYLTKTKTHTPFFCGSSANHSLNKHRNGGVWFVPIGYKLSQNEDIEWRVTFGIAEKLLVYSFTHTQLLVYALLKIVLKDVIEQHLKLKELLCSYFLKTVVFWVSEEIAVTEWTPHNFENCFSECLKRLAYYVQHDILPHYFIKERNVLEQRITLPEWRNLKTTIVELYKNFPECLASSSFMSEFFRSPQYEIVSQNMSHRLSEAYVVGHSKYSANLAKLNEVRFSLLCGQAVLTNKLMPMQVLVNCFELLKRSHDRFIFKCLFSTLCRNIGTRFTYQNVMCGGNKLHYQRLKDMLPFVIMGVRSDGVSGWNVLASYYYCIRKYSVCVTITDYVLSKFQDVQQEKLYYSEDKFTIDNLANQSQDTGLNSIYIANTMEPNDFSRSSF
ncbi:Hypothetical predicted protein [Mytilus galloprovincialis]|uniref:Mab-21-like HhH/H2TH-like domain-containing protein n=1 Tax=Mytilus galloprovincialis TaxID=29158 RepID=A0A8B6HKY2_MYTGA|nr:Hypothetical predicted protein [Mytilus galloprovincialis]